MTNTTAISDWAIMRKKLAWLEGFADAIDHKALKGFVADAREVMKRLECANCNAEASTPTASSAKKKVGSE